MSLGEALDDLDEEFARGLRQALAENPEEVRAFLGELGYLDETVEHAEPELGAAEEALLDVVEGLGNPKSADEVREIIEVEHGNLLESYSSLKHRSWISNKLNSLAKKGYVGKYREGREVKYTPDPTEAVRRWALHHERFASDLTRADADDIVADTGMKRSVVLGAIRELSDQ